VAYSGPGNWPGNIAAICAARPTQPVADPDHPRWLGALLALAYPDRVAQQRKPGGAEYRLANGRAALFSRSSTA
jgi:ATP-dependent helicase HrpB